MACIDDYCNMESSCKYMLWLVLNVVFINS
ncbi:hypothetical protein Gotur_025035 [Gossypium turneri]